MTLELGGQITVACEKTGYSAQLEFKLKVRLGVSVEIKSLLVSYSNQFKINMLMQAKP